MLTASADQDSRTKGYLIGTDDYMAKPFLPVDLRLRVARLLRRRTGSEVKGRIASCPSGFLPLSRDRNGHGECRAAAHRALHGDLSPLHLHERLDDCEAKPVPRALRVLAPSSCWNFWKSRPILSGAMPLHDR